MQWIAFINPNDFLGQAVWALLALSLLTAPMGCFMVWRKLSYFGATLAHSALLGAILGLATGVGVLSGVIGFTAVLAILLSLWLNNRKLPSDTLLGMIAHLTLAIAVIAVSLMDDLRMDLKSYLFGDVFAVPQPMFYAMLILSVLGAVVIAYCWRGFVNLSISPELAQVEGYPVKRIELVFTLTLSLTIALGMLSIGALLIVATLIIPAAGARMLSAYLRQMVFLTWVITVLSIILGMILAYQANYPAGPTIVVLQGGLFVLCYVGKTCLGDG